jgi:fatty acid desaturase
MHATARTHQLAEAPAAPARPRLREVPAPRRRRLPSAATIAVYALGLTAGFLLAALASAPGGGAVVAGQMTLALAGAVVAGLALVRARAVARRRTVARTRPAAV